ncbi:MAG: hypothetical protein J6R29_04975 [Clostridia bacterium]|nr:hypothetical protein [Clostridia bacterium]
MLDNKEKIVLNYINSNSNSGKYVVLTSEEILRVFPHFLNASEAMVKTVINNLFLKGFIRLKYDDGSTFCVSSTEQGLNYKEENTFENSPIIFSVKAIVGWCVFSSFIGAFVGVVIALFLSKILGG